MNVVIILGFWPTTLLFLSVKGWHFRNCSMRQYTNVESLENLGWESMKKHNRWEKWRDEMWRVPVTISSIDQIRFLVIKLRTEDRSIWGFTNARRSMRNATHTIARTHAPPLPHPFWKPALEGVSRAARRPIRWRQQQQQQKAALISTFIPGCS